MSTKTAVALPLGDAASAKPQALSPLAVTTAAMLLVDSLSLALIFALAVLFHRQILPAQPSGFSYHFLASLLAMLFCFASQGLYPGVLLHPADEMRRIFVAITTVFLLMACGSFFWRNAETYSRAIFFVTWAFSSPCVMFGRRLSRRYLALCRWWGVPAIVLGASSNSLARVLRSLTDGRRGIKVAGVFSDNPSDSLLNGPAPYLGPLSQASSLARSRGISIAIATAPLNSDSAVRHLARDYCRGLAHIVLVPDLPGLSSLGVTVREIGGELGLEMPQRLFHFTSALAKRCLDILFSGCALLLLSPVFLGLALAVRFSSRGDIFFGQTRYGLAGETFQALKFRTMVPNAEQVLANHLSSDATLLIEWASDHKLRNDPRITPIGRWIRRFSLDELPQLWNVLRGEMSLIGPRPIVKGEIQRYGPSFERYTCVRPGMTGLWQVSGRNRTTYEQRVALDEFYVNNWSIWLDLYILSRTLQVVITADGAF